MIDHDPAEIARGMKRLRKALLARIRAADRRETAASVRRKADGALASYDTRGLALVLRPALEWDGRGWAAIAAEIGVTSPDLSRVMAGQDISAGKVFSICDWLRIDARRFFRPVRGARPTYRGPRVRMPRRAPDGQPEPGCFTGKALKRKVAQP